MNASVLSQQYNQFTPQERLRLTLAAHARGDLTETDRLRQSCRQMTVIAPDPEYCRFVLRMVVMLGAVIGHWATVSHCVVRDRLSVMSLHVACEYDALAARVERNSGNDTDELEVDNAALAGKVDASWKSWSATWKGFEAATTRFCGDLGLTLDELFEALESPEALVIEEARGVLHPDSRVGRKYEKAIYHPLHQAWSGQAEPR